DGRVRGDIRAESRIFLTASAVVLGDIYAGTINMETGARVQGELHITKLEIAESAFADTDFDIKI
ncbi:MAG: polymer-forming cytoskeletal protein, partial [Pygmaiobacter sp.]